MRQCHSSQYFSKKNILKTFKLPYYSNYSKKKGLNSTADSYAKILKIVYNKKKAASIDSVLDYN